MNYDNIIYPLDKIYSDAVGTTYPVCGAGHDGPTPIGPTPIDPKSEYFYIENISDETGEFSINQYTSGTLEYSLDKKTWTSYDLSTKPSVEVASNNKIYLRGTGFNNGNNDGVINFNKDYNVGGNFMSLSNYTTMLTVDTIDSSNIISSAFFNQTHLISAENLNFGNVTIIGDYGLRNCFGACTNLTTPPDLSSVTSIGISGLNTCFTTCSNLTTGPDLSNVTSVDSGGLNSCFYDCSKLTTVTAPNVSDLTANYVLQNWLNGAGTSVSGTKVVNVPTGATITANSISGIPSGWTRVDY